MSLLAPDGAKLLDLTRAQRRVLDRCSENGPAIVFAWNADAVDTAAADLAVNARPFFRAPLAPVPTPRVG